MEYFLVNRSNDSERGHVEALSGVENTYMLKEGVALEGNFPENAVFTLDKSGGDLVDDIIPNINRQLMVSQRVKDWILEFSQDKLNIDWLQFTLQDKKEKPVSNNPFYIANSLDLVADVLDFEQIKEDFLEEEEEDDPECCYWDGIYYSNENKDKINDLEFLYLKEDEIPDDMCLFRIAECPKHIIIRSDLVEFLESKGCKGLSYQPMGEM